MVNKNVLGLRAIALRAFSETIHHCKVTPIVTDQVKKTRLGLARISHDYVLGLSKLYCRTNNPLPDEERSQVLKTLQDFSSISKSVKLSNIFLTTFAELVGEQ
jgi:hypothetical protein